MVLQRSTHSIAFYAAWIVAGVAGGSGPLVVAYLYPGELTLPGGIRPDLPFYTITLSAVCLAYLQYVVLSALIRRVSIAVLTWIPLSVAASLLASNWAVNYGGVASAFGVSLPDIALPLVYASQGIATGLALGVAQGFVLSRLSHRRLTIALWMGANVLAGGLVGFVSGIQFPLMVSQTPLSASVEAALFANMISSRLADAALYAAVTGPVLLALVGRGSRSPRPLTQSPEMIVTD